MRISDWSSDVCSSDLSRLVKSFLTLHSSPAHAGKTTPSRPGTTPFDFHDERCGLRHEVHGDRVRVRAPSRSRYLTVCCQVETTESGLSYQPRDRFTIATTDNITGTYTSTPTTVDRAAPYRRPNRRIAAATANQARQ